MTTYFKQLENAIKTMHYRHGIGDIQKIQQFADGRIAVIAKNYKMKPHVRCGTVTGQTFGKRIIRLYGRQLTVIIIGE